MSPEERVPIWDYGDIYMALGITVKQFSDWQERYGIDSLGVGDGGELLIPAFPILSKLPWMYIDPVDLSCSETAELVLECDRAINWIGEAPPQKILRQIRNLAVKAMQDSAVLSFGSPYLADPVQERIWEAATPTTRGDNGLVTVDYFYLWGLS